MQWGASFGGGGCEVWSCEADIEGHIETQQDGLDLAEKVKTGPGRAGQGGTRMYTTVRQEAAGLACAGQGREGKTGPRGQQGNTEQARREDQDTKGKLVQAVAQCKKNSLEYANKLTRPTLASILMILLPIASSW